MMAQSASLGATVLNGRNLLRHDFNDLPPPSLGVGEIVALRSEKWTALPFSFELLLLHVHPPAQSEHFRPIMTNATDSDLMRTD